MNRFYLLLLLGLLLGSTPIIAQSITKSSSVNASKAFIDFLKSKKTFKVSGQNVLAPDGYIWVSKGKKHLLVSKQFDQKLKGKDVYSPFFEEISIPAADLWMFCSCAASYFDSEGDDCYLALKNGVPDCTGSCTGQNDGESCSIAVFQVGGDGSVQTTQMQ